MIRALSITGAVLALDILTKSVIRSYLAIYEAVVVTPFLSIVHVQNRGAAFGVFSSLGNGFFIAVALLASAAVFYYMLRVPEHRIIMALILGGALGNLLDRLRQGYVTDFVDFHIGDLHWPAFNVADSALTVSILLLLLLSFRGPPKTRCTSTDGSCPDSPEPGRKN